MWRRRRAWRATFSRRQQLKEAMMANPKENPSHGGSGDRGRQGDPNRQHDSDLESGQGGRGNRGGSTGGQSDRSQTGRTNE
jgi:hypothetical protein